MSFNCSGYIFQCFNFFSFLFISVLQRRGLLFGCCIHPISATTAAAAFCCCILLALNNFLLVSSLHVSSCFLILTPPSPFSFFLFFSLPSFLNLPFFSPWTLSPPPDSNPFRQSYGFIPVSHLSNSLKETISTGNCFVLFISLARHDGCSPRRSICS